VSARGADTAPAGAAPAVNADAVNADAVNGEAVAGDAVGAAVAFVLRSTQQRPQTEAEVRAKLAARDVEGDVAQAALARARALGAVDDAAFARAWVDDRGAGRGFGTARLRQELRRRLVPEPLIADALLAIEDRDDLAVAIDLARDRLPSLPATLQPEAVARRLQDYLVRRGHHPGLAQRVAIEVSGLDRAWD